jgi:hypothetical protein
MRPTLFEWLLLPFVLWGMFQGALYYNANIVEEAINIAIYETSKDAALEGRYNQVLYNEMIAYLEKHHKFDPSKVVITGTEDLTYRGDYITIRVQVPKPQVHVLEIFKPSNASDFFIFEKSIMSEYTP